MELKSPITGCDNISWLRDIETSYIEEQYSKKFNIDVSFLFRKIKKISIYRDNDTGYRFYYPFNVSGDSKFYEELQRFEWYYMPWKWEHEKCVELIQDGERVLEIGCANGEFMDVLQQKRNVETTGLELNEVAVAAGRKKGRNILCQAVQDHAEDFVGYYDVVCSFQVLEHIAQVRSFIEANVQCLKKGGKLIFGVPNNDSFAKYDWKNDLLNMPPHHMGLWNRATFEGIADVFNIQLISLIFEPLQSYHLDWYMSILEKRYLTNSLLKKMYYHSRLKRPLKSVIRHNSNNIKGHSILAIFSI
ncbi:class I SAM-dependent methyltransferase [Tunicatimonas pelagia]|uniref:class I SAM-dependent methyltransferase n=1 Tax=Tunicatimonas pelagia TaxID=931531 RepID=UPI0026652060|nr:class I SAM-dependent methyltransferase [Tunicatimonas pelagia]WKN40717.1 class I SAM-dependent methyltransferase [Tunicatimonas pelagia]